MLRQGSPSRKALLLVLVSLCGPPVYAQDYVPPARKDRPNQGGPLQYGCRTEDCVAIEGIRRMHSRAPTDVAEQRRARAGAYAAQVESPGYIPPDNRSGVIAAAQDLLSAAANQSVTILTVSMHRYVSDPAGNLYCGTAIVGANRESRFVLAMHSNRSESGYNVHADSDVWTRAGCEGEGLVLR